MDDEMPQPDTLTDLFGLPCSVGLGQALRDGFAQHVEDEVACLLAEWRLVTTWRLTGQADDSGEMRGPLRRIAWKQTGVGEIVMSITELDRYPEARGYSLAWRTTVRRSGAETAFVFDAWPGGLDDRP